VYVVRKGDTLRQIARQTLQDDSRQAVLRIYNANRGKLANPDSLEIGQELRIPS